MKLLRWLILSAFAALAGLAAPAGWPSFRGPAASGVAEGPAPPVSWDVESGRNVLWSVEVPGLGASSPVIWGDRIYLTTAAGGDNRLRTGLYGDIGSVEDPSTLAWKVLCFDRATGELVWERTAHEGVPAVKRHPKSTHANPTIATDGRRLIAFFGSEGLYAYDLEGELLWKRDFGRLDSAYFEVPEAQWEFGSSPVIHDGKLLIQADVLENSFLAALDVENGRDLWRVERGDVPTWSTPVVYDRGETAQVIVNGWKHIGGYELESGKQLWRIEGGGDIPVPTPLAAGDLVFITSAHGAQSPVYAIDPRGARGDISLAGDASSNDHIVWSVPRGGSYMATPLVYGEFLYVPRWNGVLNCYRAQTGEPLYEQRLDAGEALTASPVAAGGRLYLAAESGKVYVVAAGPEFELLATNDLGGPALASPAIADGVLYVRTGQRLLAIGEPAK